MPTPGAISPPPAIRQTALSRQKLLVEQGGFSQHSESWRVAVRGGSEVGPTARRCRYHPPRVLNRAPLRLRKPKGPFGAKARKPVAATRTAGGVSPVAGSDTGCAVEVVADRCPAAGSGRGPNWRWSEPISRRQHPRAPVSEQRPNPAAAATGGKVDHPRSTPIPAPATYRVRRRHQGVASRKTSAPDSMARPFTKNASRAAKVVRMVHWSDPAGKRSSARRLDPLCRASRVSSAHQGDGCDGVRPSSPRAH